MFRESTEEGEILQVERQRGDCYEYLVKLNYFGDIIRERIIVNRRWDEDGIKAI
ncbi:MAG: hypothetical protein MUO54_07855 [Anaerolineales bacterium]|nr:hypothetical protein [Anaerolineales bacterium]